MVATGKARASLRKLTRDGEQAEYRRIGAMLAEHAFAREDRDFSTAALGDSLRRLKLDTPESLFESLGRGDLSIQKFMKAVFPGRESTKEIDHYTSREVIDDKTLKLYVKGEGVGPGQGLHLAECCSPINGDRIVGIQEAGKGVIIHTVDCEILATIDAAEEDWIDLGWRRAAQQSVSMGRITVTVEHVPGALADLTKMVGEAGGNLTNIKTLKRSPSFFDMILDIEVSDNRHLSQVIAALRTSAYVVSAHRLRAERVNAIN